MDPFKGSPLKEQCLFQLLCNYFIYLIGQNFVGQNFCRTRFWTPILNFDNFIRFLPDFCIKILDKILDGQNVTSDKIFDAKPKFRQFCPTNFFPIRYETVTLIHLPFDCHVITFHSHFLVVVEDVTYCYIETLVSLYK